MRPCEQVGFINDESANHGTPFLASAALPWLALGSLIALSAVVAFARKRR